MKKRIPTLRELAVMVALVVVCAVIVRISGKTDVGLALCGAPLFLVSAMMGMRRCDALERLALAEAEASAQNPTD